LACIIARAEEGKYEEGREGGEALEPQHAVRLNHVLIV
jgi:hypothetical protein